MAIERREELFHALGGTTTLEAVLELKLAMDEAKATFRQYADACGRNDSEAAKKYASLREKSSSRVHHARDLLDSVLISQ